MGAALTSLLGAGAGTAATGAAGAAGASTLAGTGASSLAAGAAAPALGSTFGAAPLASGAAVPAGVSALGAGPFDGFLNGLNTIQQYRSNPMGALLSNNPDIANSPFGQLLQAYQGNLGGGGGGGGQSMGMMTGGSPVSYGGIRGVQQVPGAGVPFMKSGK